MKTIKKLWLIMILVIASLSSVNVYADGPIDSPPPPPGGGHGGGGNVPGAPIDGGLGILLVLGAAYGSFRLYRGRNAGMTEEEKERPEA